MVAKLGGLAMPDNGFGWHTAERPATSDELVAAQADYYHHTIEVFGPDRCMFESNFPVDMGSCSYATLWNAFKHIAKGASAAEILGAHPALRQVLLEAPGLHTLPNRAETEVRTPDGRRRALARPPRARRPRPARRRSPASPWRR